MSWTCSCRKRKYLAKRVSPVLGYKDVTAPTWVHQDNKSAITLSCGPKVSNKRSKHFGLEFEAFREYVTLKEMDIVYRETSDLPADMLTKPYLHLYLSSTENELWGVKRYRIILVKKDERLFVG